MTLSTNQRRLLFDYDRSSPLDVRAEQPRDADGLRVEPFSFAGARGERVPAVLYRPALVSGPLPLVLVGHGLGMGKDHMLMDLLMREWAGKGLACLGVDAPFHGGRLQRLLDPRELIRRPGDGLAFATQTVTDNMRALDWVATRHDLDPRRVAYVGFSMGSVLGVQFVAMDERVRAAVFALGGAGMMHFLAGMAPVGIRAEFQSAAEAIDPLHYAPLIAPRPVLMVNGTRDSIIPASAGHVLFNALREPKRILWYDGEHGAIPREHIHEMRVFITDSLQAA